MNGKLGDHPLTDILLHNHEVYGKTCDNLIKEISKLVSREDLYEMFDWTYSLTKEQLNDFEKVVTEKLETLKNEAKERGWEVNEE